MIQEEAAGSDRRGPAFIDGSGEIVQSARAAQGDHRNVDGIGDPAD